VLHADVLLQLHPDVPDTCRKLSYRVYNIIPLATGTLLEILKQAGIGRKEIEDLL